MSESKRFYWIKLKTDFFATDGPMDLLMSQPNGAEYVLLYQMLCLQTVNTGGRLAAQVGDLLLKFDVNKIVRDCKYFDRDTVTVALSLFQKLGLIYEEQDGIIAMANYDGMVGSETDAASRMRRMRENMAEALPEPERNNERNIVTLENRDKSIESSSVGVIEDRGMGEGEPSQPAQKPRKVFVKPTLEEVTDYCEQRKNKVDPERFWNHYERVGWMVGKNRMKDWRAAVRYWERDETPRTATASGDPPGVHFRLEGQPVTSSGSEFYDDIFGGA